MRDVAATDFVHDADTQGLSPSDKRMLVSVYEDMMFIAAQYSRFFSQSVGVQQVFFELTRWHRNVICVDWLNHYSVDYTVFVRDDRVVQVVLDAAVEAYTPMEVHPPPMELDHRTLTIDSPYRAFVAAFPTLSGYLRSEGMSKMLRKVWQFLYETRGMYTPKTQFRVESLVKLNGDVTCEVRVR